MAQVTWVISGKIQVEEGDVTDVLTKRPLEDVEVEVLASNFGKYASWGAVRTNSEGEFMLREEKDESKRKIKVKVRFASGQLEVNTGALADLEDFISPGIEIFEHSNEVEGPRINIGTRTFASGASGELGDLQNRRRATAWYVWKTLIDTFISKDSYFAFNGKIKIVYPANVVSGKSYANGVTRSAYIHEKEPWSIETVIHEGMHLWNYDHNHGTANWFGAVFCPPDLNTHGQAERRPIAFHEGFAKFAAQELLHEIWGDEEGSRRTKPQPFTRYALLHDLHLDTVDEVELNDKGVFRSLCVLTARALYDRKWGDKNTPISDDQQPVRVPNALLDCPENPRVTIWDVLKVFQANADEGYATEWQVGNNDYGVRRFFERAADVLPNLDDRTKDLMLSLIDPNSTEEPQSRCTKKVLVHDQ